MGIIGAPTGGPAIGPIGRIPANTYHMLLCRSSPSCPCKTLTRYCERNNASISLREYNTLFDSNEQARSNYKAQFFQETEF